MKNDSLLVWSGEGSHQEATVGNFAQGDGVRFSLEYRPTCYRRGLYRLLVEVAHGPKHHLWGCFDAADQPERYYHLKESALTEAEAIAAVLVSDRHRSNP